MLSYNEILPKKYIVLDGDPYEVQGANIFRKQKRKPVNQTKLRNLKTGKVTEHSFHQSDTVHEADIEKQHVHFLYEKRGEAWFVDPNDPKQRFSLSTDTVGTAVQFLSDKTPVELALFEGKVIDVSLPIKIDLSVTEAPPAVRGNTSQGATKSVTLETGASVTVPLFINEGDVIRINTETGQYAERVEKG